LHWLSFSAQGLLDLILQRQQQNRYREKQLKLKALAKKDMYGILANVQRKKTTASQLN
jgi:hypothetical protein